MYRIPLDEAFTELGCTDPTFNEEVRRRLGPVKDRFSRASPRHASDKPKDGLHTVPPVLSDPELRNVAVKLAELALQRGIDENLAFERNGRIDRVLRCMKMEVYDDHARRTRCGKTLSRQQNGIASRYHDCVFIVSGKTPICGAYCPAVREQSFTAISDGNNGLDGEHQALRKLRTT